MNAGDVQSLLLGALTGLASSTVFVLALFIGFCVVFGFTKLKRTAGGSAPVIKSLDETLSRQPMAYLPPNAPRGPADQLRAPELVEAASRK
jgi:acid phosphatase family membrane protein YuiD